jgi:hypothetical protein
MSTSVQKGPVAHALDDDAAAELDGVLAERHADVQRLLDEAREARAAGRYGPLEPLHVFLRRARARFGGDA